MIYNKNNLLIVSLAGKDVHHAVRFTEKATEATNGHYLIVVETPGIPRADLPAKPFKPLRARKIDVMLSVEKVDAIRKSMPTNGPISVFNTVWFGANTKDDQVEVLMTDGRTWRPFVCQKEEGSFPNTKKLLGQSGTWRKKWRTDVWFDVDYLRKILDVYSRAGVKAIKLSVRRPDAAVRLMARVPGTDQLITTLLMPVVKGDEPLARANVPRRRKAKTDEKEAAEKVAPEA